MDDSKKAIYLEKRTALKELSKAVKPLVETGEHETVNEAIISVYSSRTGAKEFKTFKQWKEDGKSVQKGEKAFTVWGRPRKAQEGDEDDEYKFWPVCYLFSNLQVA